MRELRPRLLQRGRSGAARGRTSKRPLTISSDIYYYRLGANLFTKGADLQRWAGRLGFGRRTGIDLPAESAGLVPGPRWKARQNKAELACRREEKKDTCGIVADPQVGYLLGNNVNLSIGQGDLQATPLQLAQLYGSFYNGGDLSSGLSFVKPRLGDRVQDAEGVLVREVRQAEPRKVELPAEWKKPMMAGLRGVTSSPSGTAYKPFQGWDQDRYPVYAKTGTAQRIYPGGAEEDQSWFAAMVPDQKRPIAIAATVEAGGFGSEAARPGRAGRSSTSGTGSRAASRSPRAATDPPRHAPATRARSTVCGREHRARRPGAVSAA